MVRSANSGDDIAPELLRVRAARTAHQPMNRIGVAAMGATLRRRYTAR